MDLVKKAEENVIKYDEENAIRIIESLIRKRQRVETLLIELDADLSAVKKLTPSEIIKKYQGFMDSDHMRR